MRWFLVFIFLSGVKSAYSQELTGLFYCNDRYAFERIWIVEQDWFIGWTVSGTSNYLVSVNSEHLKPMDTLLIGTTQSDFLQHLSILNDQNFILHTLNTFIHVGFQMGKFSVVKTERALDQSFNTLLLRNENISLYQSPASDYSHKVIINGKDYFFKLALGSKKVKGFIGTYNHADFNYIFNSKEQELYLTSFDHSEFLRLNISKETFERISLPQLENPKREGYTFLFDHIQSKLYLLKHNLTEGSHTLHRVYPEEKKVIPLQTLNHEPYGIFDGLIYYMIESKDPVSKIQIQCHYAVELLENPEEPFVLDAVQIQNDK